jgi:hypothetical protein
MFLAVAAPLDFRSAAHSLSEEKHYIPKRTGGALGIFAAPELA